METNAATTNAKTLVKIEWVYGGEDEFLDYFKNETLTERFNNYATERLHRHIGMMLGDCAVTTDSMVDVGWSNNINLVNIYITDSNGEETRLSDDEKSETLEMLNRWANDWNNNL